MTDEKIEISDQVKADLLLVLDILEDNKEIQYLEVIQKRVNAIVKRLNSD